MHTDPTRQLTSDYNALVRAGYDQMNAAAIAHNAKRGVPFDVETLRMARESLKEENDG